MMKKQLPHCDVELTVTLISDRWKILILRDLLTGTKRFGELKKSVSGISQKVLTAHLRSMEDDGLVNRKIYIDSILFSKVGSDAFYHSFATRRLESGYDIRIIRKRIGNSDVFNEDRSNMKTADILLSRMQFPV